MQGLKIGHHTREQEGTGVSVFLFDKPAIGAYLICGASPASHELAPLDAENSVTHVHGLVLAGGSAFGLFSAAGVMRFLEERKIGVTVPHGVVPIVPAAAIYDLSFKAAIPPYADDAYQACQQAIENNELSGAIGAGTGATVGKLVPSAHCMTSGIGRAEVKLSNGVSVLAYAVVNAVGDVYDQQGQIIAGAQGEKGEWLNCSEFLLKGGSEINLVSQDRLNTTLVALFTNASFSKGELKQIAKIAVGGMARAIRPVFTGYDGDTIFALSVGEQQACVLAVGEMAAQAVQLAIIDAVKAAKVVYP